MDSSYGKVAHESIDPPIRAEYKQYMTEAFALIQRIHTLGFTLSSVDKMGPRSFTWHSPRSSSTERELEASLATAPTVHLDP